ncbi:hypothetical protein J1N35_043713, partial [Gossypium stocksii]
AYVERRDADIKRFLQKNFTKPMPTFPNFPKELHSNEVEGEGEVEANVTDHIPTYHATKKQKAEEL